MANKKEEIKDEQVEAKIEGQQEEQQEAAPEEPKKAEEKKTWFQRHAEKKAKYAEEHPKKSKLIDNGKKIGGGILIGFALKVGADFVKSMLGNRSNGSGASGNDVIDTTYTDVTDNDSNN